MGTSRTSSYEAMACQLQQLFWDKQIASQGQNHSWGSLQKAEQEKRKNTSCVGRESKTTRLKYSPITSHPEETGIYDFLTTGHQLADWMWSQQSIKTVRAKILQQYRLTWKKVIVFTMTWTNMASVGVMRRVDHYSFGEMNKSLFKSFCSFRWFERN